MAQSTRKIKRSGASLNGGILVGIAVVALAMLISGELGLAMPVRWGISIILGGVMGAWVRIADL
jgi:hypothetical protein